MIINSEFALTKQGNTYKKSNYLGTAAILGCIGSIPIPDRVVDTFIKKLPETSNFANNLKEALKKPRGKAEALLLAGLLIAGGILDAVLNKKRANEADKQMIANNLHQG